MVRFLCLFLLIGCGETSPETLVDELRVIASIAEPPEVKPGETFTYTSYIANPDDEDTVAASWVCTNLGDGCLEAQGGVNSLSHTEPEGQTPVWTRDLSVTPALAPIVAEDAVTATQLWTLACIRGTCPVIDEIAALSASDAWPDELSEQLANPTNWMSDLPMSGVSLAYQLLTTSLSDEPQTNPTLTATDNRAGLLVRGETFSLSFTVDGTFTEQAQVYNYITGGGFKMANTYVTAGDTVELEGTAPKDGDEAHIWVVLADGLGGVAVWTQTFPLTG